jgi:hypothetical protein
MLNQRGIRESHSPLHGRSVFGREGRHRCGILTASFIKVVGKLPVCHPSQERNRIYARIHTQQVHPDCEKWVSATSIAQTSKRTQQILLRHSAPKIFWSQQNLDLLSVNIERRSTYTEIEEGHKGPTLPLQWITRIFMSLFWCGSPLTQISSTYNTILSKLAVSVIDRHTSCLNASAENTIRISVIF